MSFEKYCLLELRGRPGEILFLVCCRVQKVTKKQFLRNITKFVNNFLRSITHRKQNFTLIQDISEPEKI